MARRIKSRMEEKERDENITAAIILAAMILAFVSVAVVAPANMSLMPEEVFFGNVVPRAVLAVTVILMVVGCADYWYKWRCDSYYRRRQRQQQRDA